jgi:hypothetical protein
LYFNPSIVKVSFTGIQSTFALRGFILDCIGSVTPVSAMVFMTLLIVANCCLNYGTAGMQGLRTIRHDHSEHPSLTQDVRN